MKLIVLFIGICIFTAIFKPVTLPFLTFSQAKLYTSNKTIYAHNDEKNPLLQIENQSIRTKHNIPQSIQKIDGDLLIIADDKLNLVTHYFHFMEHLLGIWNFLTYKNPNNVKMILFNFAQSSAQDNLWHGYNNINLQLLQHIFPNATISLLSELPSNLCINAHNIYVSSRVLSHLDPISSYTNMNGVARKYYNPNKIKKMRDLLFAKMQIETSKNTSYLRVTYVKRDKVRIMPSILENNLIANIEQITKHPVNIVDFANLTFKEQLQIIANTDLLIGVHGNGLTHLVFLPDNATLLEYYAAPNTPFYRVFAQIRGLRYHGNYKEKWYSKYIQTLNNDYQGNDVESIDLKRTLILVKRLHREYTRNANALN